MFMYNTIVFNNNVISTKESIYRDSPIGKLEETSLVKNLITPLQQGFDSDSKTCLPIGINYLTTLAFENRVGNRMSLANSTAVATPFTSMISINNIQSNVFIKTSLFKNLFKFIERDSHNLMIKSLSKCLESFKVFNSNISVIFDSQISNISNDFSKPIFDKVCFSVLQQQEFFPCFIASSISKGLECSSALHKSFSFSPQVFPKVSLVQNFSLRSENTSSEAFAVDIDSENVFSLRQNGFCFGEVSNDLLVGSQSECFTLPTTQQQSFESLVVPVLFDGYRDSFSWVYSECNKVIVFSVEGFAVSRNIEFDCNVFEGSSFCFDNVSLDVTDDLASERGGFFAF